MQFLLLALIALIANFLAEKIRDYIKIESQIIYLIFGILVAMILGLEGIEGIDVIFPNITLYTTTALLFMFFAAGFSINLKQLKKSGKVTAKLFTIPSYVETFIMSFVLYYALRLFPEFTIELPYVECLLIAGILASASPANVIPSCVNLLKERYVDKNNIPATMIMAMIIDGFVTVPISFICIFIMLKTSTGTSASILDIVVIALAILAAIVIALILGILIGRLELFFMSVIFKNLTRLDRSKFIDYTVILLAFIVAISFTYLVASIDVLTKAMMLFGILVVCGIGISINHFDKTDARKIIARDSNKIFTTFGMPIIFMYVGSIINMNVLLSPTLLMFLGSITIIAVTIKYFTTKLVLRDKKYTKGERTFAATCYIPKGVSLVNFAIIFSVILSSDADIITFMLGLATITIIITMSIAIPTLNGAKDKLIFKRSNPTREYN